MIALFMFIPENVGGAERRLVRIFNAIAKDGKDIDFIVISTKTNMDKFYRENISHIFFHETIIFGVSHFESIKALLYLVSGKYKAVVYFDGSKYSVLLNLLAAFRKVKTLMIYADYFAAYNMYRGRKKFYFDFSVITASHVDCLYPAAEIGLKKRFPKKNITITPNSFTDLDRFRPADKEKLMVFASANLSRKKNPHLLLEALNIIQDKIRTHGYKIFICGGGSEQRTLIERSIADGTDDIIVFLGSVNMKDYLPQAELFFSLQTFENYPSQALLEAISCGCYIIATDVGSTKMIVDGAIFSTLVQDDKQELARAIVSYLNLELGQKEAHVKLARQFAEKNFLLETNIVYFSNILHQLTE